MPKRIKISGNNVFYLLLLVVFIVIITALIIGEKQDAKYVLDHNKLALANKYLNEGNLEKAEPLYAEIAAEHPESFKAEWLYGKCLADKGDYRQAKLHYEKAQAIFPYIVKDHNFDIQMGQVLFDLKEYQKSADYLQVALLINKDAKVKEQVESLLDQISKSNG